MSLFTLNWNHFNITPHRPQLEPWGSSTEKIYEELSLESLKSKRWYRKMSFLYKVLKSESLSYMLNTIPNINKKQHQTRNSDNIPSFFDKHGYCKNSFFPSATNEWNKLDCYIRNTDSFEVFKKRLLSLLDPCPKVSTTSITLLELNILQD